MRDRDKFRGCLIGGAAGDALGYAVEFMPAAAIFQKYGPGGITEYDLGGGLGRISDDTQMTMFTATGLLAGTTRGMTRGSAVDRCGYIFDAYRGWYRTQTENWPLKKSLSPDGTSAMPFQSWLMDVPGMVSARAPGNTCMSAIGAGTPGSMERPLNNSKGCGGVMRVAPVGLYFGEGGQCYEAIEESDLLAARAAALTHGHPMGYIPAAMLAHIVRRESESGMGIGEAAREALRAMPALFPGEAYRDGLFDFTGLILRALALAENDRTDLENIRSLGEGWVGDEALAIAVYCADRYEDDLERCLVAAVNHSGDSDSTGAIAGNILGAKLGYDAIPEKFKTNLELRDVILELADDLCNDCPIDEYHTGGDPAWVKKYIEMTHGG